MDKIVYPFRLYGCNGGIPPTYTEQEDRIEIIKKTLVLLMTLLLLCLTAGALADNEVEFKPGPDELTVEKVHTRAAAFFSVKCGIPFEALQIARA